MIKSAAIVLGLAAGSMCANSAPVARTEPVCPPPAVETSDAGTMQPPTGETQCLRTNAFVAIGVMADLAASIDPSTQTQGSITVPSALQMYASYGVDGLEIAGPVDTWSDSGFDGSEASAESVVHNLRLTFGGTVYDDPTVAADSGGYWTAKRLYDAMSAAKETKGNPQTTRSSPNGFVSCDFWSDETQTSYSCAVTNLRMLNTRLVPCSQKFLLEE